MILKPICIWLQSCMVLVAVGEFLSSHATKHKRILSKWFFISNCGFQWKRKGDSNAILWSVSDRKSENRQVTMFPQVVASFLGAAAASWPPRPWPGPWPGSVLVARSPGPVAGLGAGPGASARSTRPPWARPWSGPRARPATATAAAATTPLALFKDPYPSASKLRTIQLVKSIPKIFCCASKSFKLMSIDFCRKIELTPCRRATQTQQLPLHSDSKKNIYSYNCSRKKFMLRLHLMSVCVVDFACLAHEILQVLQKNFLQCHLGPKRTRKKSWSNHNWEKRTCHEVEDERFSTTTRYPVLAPGGWNAIGEEKHSWHKASQNSPSFHQIRPCPGLQSHDVLLHLHHHHHCLSCAPHGFSFHQGPSRRDPWQRPQRHGDPQTQRIQTPPENRINATQKSSTFCAPHHIPSSHTLTEMFLILP